MPLLDLLAPGGGMGGGGATVIVVGGTWTESARAIVWRFPTMSILVKRVAEVRTYLGDLSQLPEIVAGDTVASVTSIVCTGASQGGTASDLTLTNKSVYGTTGATCKIAGGVDGITYTLEFTVVTAAGYTLVGVGYLYVDDR